MASILGVWAGVAAEPGTGMSGDGPAGMDGPPPHQRGWTGTAGPPTTDTLLGSSSSATSSLIEFGQSAGATYYTSTYNNTSATAHHTKTGRIDDLREDTRHAAAHPASRLTTKDLKHLASPHSSPQRNEEKHLTCEQFMRWAETNPVVCCLLDKFDIVQPGAMGPEPRERTHQRVRVQLEVLVELWDTLLNAPKMGIVGWDDMGVGGGGTEPGGETGIGVVTAAGPPGPTMWSG